VRVRGLGHRLATRLQRGSLRVCTRELKQTGVEPSGRKVEGAGKTRRATETFFLWTLMGMTRERRHLKDTKNINEHKSARPLPPPTATAGLIADMGSIWLAEQAVAECLALWLSGGFLADSGCLSVCLPVCMSFRLSACLPVCAVCRLFLFSAVIVVFVCVWLSIRLCSSYNKRVRDASGCACVYVCMCVCACGA
jgi:hypothetical protein